MNTLFEDATKFKSAKLKDNTIHEFHVMCSTKDLVTFPPDKFLYLGEGVIHYMNGRDDWNYDMNKPEDVHHFWYRLNHESKH